MTIPNTPPHMNVTPKAPVSAMWICMVLAWLFLVLPIPGAVFIGGPLNLAAFILAIVCLARGRVLQGVLGLIGTSAVSGLLYIISWGWLGVIVSDHASTTPSTLQEAALRMEPLLSLSQTLSSTPL